MKKLKDIMQEINSRADDFNIGRLQSIRKDIHNNMRIPSNYLFDPRTTKEEEYAFHYGGRKELQFNVGIEDKKYLRYGVAFSFQYSQTVTSIDFFHDKVELFNEYIDNFGKQLSDLKMWCYDNDKRSKDYALSPIPKELIRKDVFIFLGEKQYRKEIDYDQVLGTLDRLLPLYEYIEKSIYRTSSKKQKFNFKFSPEHKERPSFTSGNLVGKELDIRLRHNDIQSQLYEKLVKEYGNDNVGTENDMNGVKIDVIVKQKNEYWFYEIKTASTARACIREALGQILEYSYWPGHQKASKLIIVGEPKANKQERDYVKYLKDKFKLPIEYLQFKVSD